MTHDRLIQAIALAGVLGGTAVCGSVLPGLAATAEEHMLRYTNVAVDGAPPVVALGTAIGALRGLIVDYLWIKVHLNKQKGLYYEVMADSDLITKLQPRFAAVWAFHGHNMAYNISVAHNTEPERWEWVKEGIDLVRDRGLRYNPNDLQLHRELSFWFIHKIEGVSDDAHLYYKRELAREWHNLLGAPPLDHEARIDWIRTVADAPGSVEEAKRRTPKVAELIERLHETLTSPSDRSPLELDRGMVERYTQWQGLTGQSTYAQIFRLDLTVAREDPRFGPFDALARDSQYGEAWAVLLATLRKRVLLDEYNMDPQLMYEFTRDYGPIDWRSGYAHALFWSLKGTVHGEERVAVSEEDVYRIVNNDRLKLQAMQGLARWGRISFDAYSADWVSRLPDPRWIGVIDRYWEEYSIKHEHTRGPGSDLFMAFHQNFLSSAVRELYRSGEMPLAQRYLDRLDDLYCTNAEVPDFRFCQELEVFVWRQVQEEYEFQPHLAPSDVAASLRYAYRIGIGRDRPEVLKQALAFAERVTTYFKTNNYNAFVTKMGSERLGAMIQQLEGSVITVFGQLMTDTTIGLAERLVIWQRAPDNLKVRVYDGVRPHIEGQLEIHPLGRLMPIQEALPEPPGMDAYRIRRAEDARKAAEEKDKRPEVERK